MELVFQAHTKVDLVLSFEVSCPHILHFYYSNINLLVYARRGMIRRSTSKIFKKLWRLFQVIVKGPYIRPKSTNTLVLL